MLSLILLGVLFAQTQIVVVHDTSGYALPHANVRFLSTDRAFQAQADVRGVAIFSDMTPGIYDVEVSVPGFRTQTIPRLNFPAINAEPLDVTLHIANQPDHCGFVNTADYFSPAPGAQLSGRAIDQDSSSGLGRVKLQLLKPGSKVEVSSLLSDREGNFSFANIEAGRYDIHASKHGWRATALENFLVPRGNSTMLTIGLDRIGHLHICQ